MDSIPYICQEVKPQTPFTMEYIKEIVNNIIDHFTVNEKYEERGHNFEKEEDGRLVFSITNYVGDSEEFFKKTVEEVVERIEMHHIKVLKTYLSNSPGVYIIETENWAN